LTRPKRKKRKKKPETLRALAERLGSAIIAKGRRRERARISEEAAREAGGFPSDPPSVSPGPIGDLDFGQMPEERPWLHGLR